MDQLYYDSIDLLKALIATPRASRHEAAAADLVADFLCAHGLNPERIGCNVVAWAGGYDRSLPTLMLNSHIDTVSPCRGWTRDPYAPEVDEDRLYGIGSNDAGASLVSMLGVTCHMADHPELHPRYNLVMVASAEEEISGAGGLRAVLPELPPIEAAIVGEPTGLNPAIAEKGLMVIDACVTGCSAHAASGLGINAIYRAADCVAILRDMAFDRISHMLGPVHITVSQIEGGVKHNVVPDRCTMVIDVRTTDAYSNLETLQLMRQKLPEYITLAPRSTHLNPSSISAGHPLVQRLTTLGRRPYGSPTLSDQALMPWPSLKLGPGESSRSHTPDEYVTLSSIREAQAMYVTLLTHLSL